MNNKLHISRSQCTFKAIWHQFSCSNQAYGNYWDLFFGRNSKRTPLNIITTNETKLAWEKRENHENKHAINALLHTIMYTLNWPIFPSLERVPSGKKKTETPFLIRFKQCLRHSWNKERRAQPYLDQRLRLRAELSAHLFDKEDYHLALCIHTAQGYMTSEIHWPPNYRYQKVASLADEFKRPSKKK